MNEDQGELFGGEQKETLAPLLSGAVEEQLSQQDLITNPVGDCEDELERLRAEVERLREENARLLDDPGANRVGKFTTGRSGSTESQLAALREMPKTGTKRAETLRLLTVYGDGLADYQLQEITHWDIRCVNARRKELEQGGWVVKAEEQRLAPSGNHVSVWRLSTTAIERLLGEPR